MFLSAKITLLCLQLLAACFFLYFLLLLVSIIFTSFKFSVSIFF